MKMKKVIVRNFCGIEGKKEFDMPHIVALVGSNGTGKSTIINAIKYGLTGSKPEGDVINKNATEMSVEIVMEKDEEEISFSRTEHHTKASKFRVNGLVTTQKALNAFIEETCGINVDDIKIASSSEIVAAMKPQEFASFILGYIPEKMTAEDVLGLIPEATLEEINFAEALLPEEVTLESLDDVDSIIRAQRKDLKASIQVIEANLAGKITEAPSLSREEVEKELMEISNVENAKRLYEAELKAYNNAENILNSQLEMIKSLKVEANAIAATRPDPGKKAELLNRIESIKDTISNHNKTVIGVNSSLEQLKITLDSLHKPICPISPLITCHENKSVAIEEINDSINATEEGLVALNKELEKAENALKDAETDLITYDKLSKEYEKKVSLLKQAKNIEDNLPKLPEKPVAPEEIDVEDRKFQLNEILKNIISYEEGVKLSASLEKSKKELETLESLVKAFSEKGPVRQGILKKYLGIFEDLCNERSRMFRPEISFKFESDNGVVVYMDNGKGSMLPYESLSTGEKAYFMFVIMDMLNQLSGVNILLLDELSVIDSSVFEKFVSTVLEHKDDYDHIIMSAVNHIDTVDVLTKLDVNTLNFDTIEK